MLWKRMTESVNDYGVFYWCFYPHTPRDFTYDFGEYIMVTMFTLRSYHFLAGFSKKKLALHINITHV